MKLIDEEKGEELLQKNENQEFAYSGRDFIDVGEDKGVLFDSDNLTLRIKGFGKSDLDYGSDGLVIKCEKRR